MVMAQLGLAGPDALALIRADAYCQGRPLREIAHDIVIRRLAFHRRRGEEIVSI